MQLSIYTRCKDGRANDGRANDRLFLWEGEVRLQVRPRLGPFSLGGGDHCGFGFGSTSGLKAEWKGLQGICAPVSWEQGAQGGWTSGSAGEALRPPPATPSRFFVAYHACMSPTDINTHTYIHTYIHRYIQTKQSYMQTCIHTYRHTHIHTNIHPDTHTYIRT